MRTSCIANIHHLPGAEIYVYTAPMLLSFFIRSPTHSLPLSLARSHYLFGMFINISNFHLLAISFIFALIQCTWAVKQYTINSVTQTLNIKFNLLH